jgi:hypothetical protein
MCQDFQNSGRPFPQNPQQLYEVFNQQLQHMGVKLHPAPPRSRRRIHP